MRITEAISYRNKIEATENLFYFWRSLIKSNATPKQKMEDIKMDYKDRMRNEYIELKDKYDKLHRMLVKYDAGKLDFTPTCPIELLREQASTMGKYLYILEMRALIEEVEL